MKRASFIIIAILLSIATVSTVYTQQEKDKTKGEGKKKKLSVYSEQTLEDFETNDYTTEKNLKFRFSRYQKAGLVTKDQNKDKDAYPAPTAESKKYIGVKFLGKSKDVLIIEPAKEIAIEKYCNELYVWVYGKRMTGELSVLLKDARGRNHRLVFGRLNFLGWRKLKVALGKRIHQSDAFLNQKKYVKIIHLQYRPGTRSQVPIWHYFYIDDLTAKVRNKYVDRQSDDW